MTEAAFLSELAMRTGAALLLDVANVHANARTHGFDARALLDDLSLERIERSVSGRRWRLPTSRRSLPDRRRATVGETGPACGQWRGVSLREAA
jgi:hypothetical protein